MEFRLINDSLDVQGKYWLLPMGEVIDVTTSEHAHYARAHMLKMTLADAHQEISLADIFKPLTNPQWACAVIRGADKDALDFLSAPSIVDPRRYVIEKLDWIRTRKNHFYAWEWDERTLLRFATSDEFWKQQPSIKADSWLEFVEVKTNRHSGRPFSCLMSPEFAEAAC